MEMGSVQSALLHKQAEVNSSSDASKSAAKDAHMLDLGLGSLVMHSTQGQLLCPPLQHQLLLYSHPRCNAHVDILAEC